MVIMGCVNMRCGLTSCDPGWKRNCSSSSVLLQPKNPNAPQQVVTYLLCSWNHRLWNGCCVRHVLICTNTECWLQFSIYILIVSEYNIIHKSTDLDPLSPPILHFEMWSTFVVLRSNHTGHLWLIVATKPISFRSLIVAQDAKDHLMLCALLIYHTVILMEIKYLIAAKILSGQKCGNVQKTIGWAQISFLIRFNLPQSFNVSFT